MGSFRRDVQYHVSRPEAGKMMLTATMRDSYHDIVLEVLVQESDLTILAATADFYRSPEELCPSVALRLEKMIGVTIGKGLTRAIMSAAGGGEGCVNIRNLLSGLLPLAINVKAAAGYTDERAMLDAIREKLAGTCAGYPAQENDNREDDDKSYIC